MPYDFIIKLDSYSRLTLPQSNITAIRELSKNTVVRHSHHVDVPGITILELVCAQNGAFPVDRLFITKGHELSTDYKV